MQTAFSSCADLYGMGAAENASISEDNDDMLLDVWAGQQPI